MKTRKSSTKPKVIIIDDDQFQMKDYERALSAVGFQVIMITTMSGLDSLFNHKKHQDASFFLVDMMMPPGTRYRKEETDNGVFTGLFVSRDIRERFPIIPVVLWTSAHLDTILAQAKQHAIEIGNCLYAAKVNVSPNDLVRELTYYLVKRRFRPKVLRLIWKGICLGASILRAGAAFKGLAK